VLGDAVGGGGGGFAASYGRLGGDDGCGGIADLGHSGEELLVGELSCVGRWRRVEESCCHI
jgi:hypothetical protein